MEKNEVALEDLERMAAAMVQAMPDLDCPECCDCGWTYQYVELSAQLYRDELEWSCLSSTIVHYHIARKSNKSEPGSSR